MVASVNGEAITESELNRQTELLLVRLKQTDTALPSLPELHKQLLERMILEKLQKQLAASEGIEVDDATLNQAINEIAERDGISAHQMQQFLEEQGIPFSQFRETIKTEILLSKLQQKEIGQNIIISKADIENFLRSPAGQDHSGTEYHLGHILIPLPEEPSQEDQRKTVEEANTIIKALRSGADFSKTAMAKSSGQQALSGGDLGWRKIAEIPTLFAKVVQTMHKGDIIGPLKDGSGSHIIKLLDKRLLKESSPDAMRNRAMEILYQRKFDEHLITWLRRLRSDTEVEIFLNEH